MEQTRPRRAPTSGLGGWGTPPGSPAGFFSFSSGPGGPLPPASSALSQPPSYAPGPTQPGGGLEGGGPPWELSWFPGLKWVGQTSSAPSPALPVLESTPCLRFLFYPGFPLCPQDQHSPEGASEGVGLGPRARHTSLGNRAGYTLDVSP